MLVRRAEPGDAEAAAEVVRRSITELCVADHRGDESTLRQWLANKTPQSFRAWLASRENFCVVAQAGERIVGVGLLHCIGEIRLCYLLPGEERRGVGRAIVSLLEEKAREWGVSRLTLESTLGARPFYAGLGYRISGATRPGFGITHCHPYEKNLEMRDNANERAVLRYVELFNRGDFDAIREVFAADAVIYGVLGWGGLDEAIPIWRQIHDAFQVSLHVEAIAEEGNTVAVRYTERGRSAAPFRGLEPTGKPYEVVAMEWFELEQGKIRRRWGARDMAAQFRQMGLPLG